MRKRNIRKVRLVLVSLVVAANFLSTSATAEPTAPQDRSFIDSISEALSSVAKNLKKEGEEKRKHFQEEKEAELAKDKAEQQVKPKEESKKAEKH